MASRFLVKDRDNKPYALVEISAEGATFFPAVTGAKSWSKWMTEEFAGKKITREQLTVTLDNSMSVESSVSDSMVEEIKNRAEKKDEQEKKDAQSEGNLVPVVSLMDIQLSEFSSDIWENAVQYKAVAFIADQNKSSFSYEVKRTRAVWDPSLAVPGTNRRGGFRCPVGTRYGGQITDRFGRNCGWGVARRLANEISDLGERLENVGDRRRERRVARRNERMARRLAEGGAIERGARAIGDALDLTGMGGRQRGGRQRVGQQTEAKPVGRIERAARRVAEIADPDRGRGNTAPRGGRGVRVPDAVGVPSRPRRRRGEGLRDSEARRMEREIVRPGAARTGPQLGGMLDENGNVIPVGGGRRPAPRQRPAAPVRPARPRPARPAAQRPAPAPRDNVSNVPVPAGAPAARESLDAYKLRKYNEHQAEVRRIRERGGRAGFLRREEWERFHGPAVEAAWRERNPDAPEAAPAAPRPAARPRPNAGRNRRTGAAAQNGRRPAARRPRPADQPEQVQPSAPRPSRQPRPAAQPRPRGRAAAGRELPPDTLRPAGVRARIGEGRLNDGAETGRLPQPLIVRNSNIQTKQQAVEHVKNGGNLDEVPHEFWRDAIKENVRNTRNPNGRFKELRKNGGAIGDTQIFVMLDERGNKTNRGWVFKAASVNDNMNELVGWNLAAAHGFDIEGAHLDGKSTNGRRFVILPFASQNIPEDWRGLGPGPGDRNTHHGDANFHVDAMNQLADRAYPQRTRQFVFNYLLGIGDRHGQNGWGKVYEKPDGTKVAHVMPIDLGWAGRDVQQDPLAYMRNFRMENQRFDNFRPRDFAGEMRQHLAGLPAAERTRQRDAIIKAVDDMISEGRQLANMRDTEVAAFAERMFPTDMDAASRRTAIDTVKRTHRVYAQQHQRLVAERTRLINALVG